MDQHIQEYRQSLVTDLIKSYNPIWKILVPYKDRFGPSGRKLYAMASKIMDEEDIISTCYYGAVLSAQQFDPSKAKFVTFACRGIYNELRRQLVKYNDFSGDDYESHPKRSDFNLELLLKRKEDDGEEGLESVKLCERAFGKLSESSGIIVRKYYGIDCPQQTILEIAKELGRTYEQIKNIVEMSIEAVKDEYEGKSLFSSTQRSRPPVDRNGTHWKEWLNEESCCTV